MHQKEEDYIALIIAGNSAGLEKIYQLFFVKIGGFILKSGGTIEDAQDVFQDALMIIFEKAQEEDFVLSSAFYTYLYGICRKLWRNRLQKIERRTALQINYVVEEMTTIDHLIEQEEEHRIFWFAFNKLGKDCKKILKLFFENTAMAVIQKIMGYGSVGYTAKRKFQCKEKLIELIKADDAYKELNT